MNFIIRTNHLVLRPLSDRDTAALNKITDEGPVVRWVPKLNPDQDPEAIRKQLLNFMAQYEAATKHKAGMLFTVTLGREKFIGMMGVSAKEEAVDGIEIAYFISQTYTIQGYTAEAVEAVSKWVKDDLALDYAIAMVDTGARPFQRVTVKSGFVHVDTHKLLDGGEALNKPFFHYQQSWEDRKTG